MTHLRKRYGSTVKIGSSNKKSSRKGLAKAVDDTQRKITYALPLLETIGVVKIYRNRPNKATLI